MAPLQIVPENPEIEHVSGEMQQSPWRNIELRMVSHGGTTKPPASAARGENKARE
jgi:hypothetical protein